jgi:hypothetical protein
MSLNGLGRKQLWHILRSYTRIYMEGLRVIIHIKLVLKRISLSLSHLKEQLCPNYCLACMGTVGNFYGKRLFEKLQIYL